MNFAYLVGRLTTDPKKIEANEKVLCRFTLATNCNYTKDGERVTQFINVIVWGTKAENCLKYLTKGSLISVLGEIQTRNYEVDGEKKYSTEIVAKEIEFLSTKKNDEK